MKINLRVSVTDAIFYLIFFMLFTCGFYNTTTFKGVVDISVVQNIFRIFSIILLAYKCILIDRFNLNQLLVCSVLVIIASIALYSSNRGELLDFMLIVIGSRRVNDKQIVKTYFILGTLYLLITIACSLTGVIVNYSTIRLGVGTVRYAFGIVYSTDFAAHIFFLVLAYHYIRKKKIKFKQIIVHVVIVIFLDRYCDSRFSEFLILLTLLLFFINDYRDKIFKSKVFIFVSNWITAVCGIFSVAVTYMYSNTNVMWIAVDELLFSNRLKIGKKVIDLYGFTPFGQFIKMQGMGYKIHNIDTSLGITYIDSSYLQLILLYGVVFFTIMMTCYIYCSKKINMEGNTKLSIIIVLIALSGILNQYLINIAYNPFVVILGIYLLHNNSLNKIRIKH